MPVRLTRRVALESCPQLHPNPSGRAGPKEGRAFDRRVARERSFREIREWHGNHCSLAAEHSIGELGAVS